MIRMDARGERERRVAPPVMMSMQLVVLVTLVVLVLSSPEDLLPEDALLPLVDTALLVGTGIITG
jgi:hypothetical protein